MKKLLKSILIATASVGAVAGTTAAVVSCGENSKSTDQVKYEEQCKTLLGALQKQWADHPLEIAKDTSVDQIKDTIADAIEDAIGLGQANGKTDTNYLLNLFGVSNIITADAEFPTIAGEHNILITVKIQPSVEVLAKKVTTETWAFHAKYNVATA